MCHTHGITEIIRASHICCGGTISPNTYSALFMVPSCNHPADSFHKNCTVAENWFGCNSEYHEQHNALQGHMGDAKNVAQPDAANQQAHDAAAQDAPAQRIHGLADVIHFIASVTMAFLFNRLYIMGDGVNHCFT